MTRLARAPVRAWVELLRTEERGNLHSGHFLCVETLGPTGSASLQPYGSASLVWFTHINRVLVDRKNELWGSAAAIPTPRSNAPLKLSAACPPAGCSANLAASGLGASTSATELAAKTLPAMGEVVAFPTRLCWSHARVCEKTVSQNRWFFIKVVSCCNRRERPGGQV